MTKSKIHRRDFLAFLGKGSLGAGVFLTGMAGLSSCQNQQKPKNTKIPFEGLPNFEPLQPSNADEVALVQGLDYRVLLRFEDSIGNGDYFGAHCDYLAFLADEGNEMQGYLWVNHEYMHPLFVHGKDTSEDRRKEHVDKELYAMGGTLVRLKWEEGRWGHVASEENRRYTGLSPIPFHWDAEIEGRKVAQGTFANCSGGITPWGTILTCEENYDYYFGEREHVDKEKRDYRKGVFGYEAFYDCMPEHYGWVVEVNPKTKEARKLVALGRFAHECATPFLGEGPGAKLVVYTGDDAEDEHLYKFVSETDRDLKNGTLYVANLEKGEWMALDFETQPVLQEHFNNQTDVLIYARKAAKLLGATALDRPEDIDIDPLTGDVFLSLTNNKAKGNYHGSIIKIKEASADKTALRFEWEQYLGGGEENGFSSPDNLAFDPAGNLWFTSDISGSMMGKGVYAEFLNNSLFVVPRSGSFAGKVLRIANAPTDAEFTGPFFHPNGKSLFLSVQHPGERSKSLTDLSSHWPDGGDSVPRSSVIVIEGRTLEAITGVG